MRKTDPKKHEEKRQEILAAARACFAQNGFRGTAISAICKTAGISPGHLYHYFASKEAILSAIVHMVLAQHSAHFCDAMASADALAGLIAGIEQSKAQGDSHLAILDMFAEAGRNEAVAAILQDHSQGMQSLLARFLRQGQAQGRIDAELDAEIAAALLISTMDGARMMRLRHPGLAPEGMLGHLRLMVARLLAPPHPEAD